MQRTKPCAEFELQGTECCTSAGLGSISTYREGKGRTLTGFERSEVWRLYFVQPYLQKKPPNSLQAARSYELVRFSPQSSVFAAVTAVLIKEATALACNLESTSIDLHMNYSPPLPSSRNNSPSYSFGRLSPTSELPMRQQRTQRMSTPAPTFHAFAYFQGSC